MWLFSPFPMGGRTFTKHTVRNTSFGQQPRTANLLETFVHEIELKDPWTELDALFHNEKLRGSSGWERGGRLGAWRQAGQLQGWRDAFVHHTSQQTGLFGGCETL